MFRPSKVLQNKYERLNKMYFHGELRRAEVGWNDELPDIYHGLTTAFYEETGNLLYFNIALHPQLRLHKSNKFISLVLLHEMAHVHLYPILNHGRRFQEEMTRLAVAGAFHDFW